MDHSNNGLAKIRKENRALIVPTSPFLFLVAQQHFKSIGSTVVYGKSEGHCAGIRRLAFVKRNFLGIGGSLGAVIGEGEGKC
jgi:hypothetical protein